MLTKKKVLVAVRRWSRHQFQEEGGAPIFIRRRRRREVDGKGNKRNNGGVDETTDGDGI